MQYKTAECYQAVKHEKIDLWAYWAISHPEAYLWAGWSRFTIRS
ncbi:hypothetical protein [Runella salmonicolor]|nr:hypothetical protein [Runella salmonicolor]